MNFRYLGGGKAVANVLHHDRLGVTFDGEVDPAVQPRIEGLWSESGSTPQDATVWELHVIDLASGTSKVVTGFRPEHDVGSYSIFQRVDGRVLITFQFDVEEITNNAVYELDLAAATVTHVGSVAGELGSVVRVR